jgi:hypothetical protein
METGAELKFRYYRRVIGMVIMDRIVGTPGFFCARCRPRLFARNMLLTLVLGWWGVLAMLFRNPFAIATNVWALFKPPMDPASVGAIHLKQLLDEADASEEPADLATLYAHRSAEKARPAG